MRVLRCGPPWMPVWDAGVRTIAALDGGSSVLRFPEDESRQILTMFRDRDVLIIDDEESIVRVTSLMVERLGLTPRGTVSGLDGVDLWLTQRDSIGVLILDIMLADSNGLDIYEQIRPLDRELPIVLFSGFSQADLLDDILSTDARTRFLPKPFGALELQHVLAGFGD